MKEAFAKYRGKKIKYDSEMHGDFIAIVIGYSENQLVVLTTDADPITYKHRVGLPAYYGDMICEEYIPLSQREYHALVTCKVIRPEQIIKEF